MLLIVWCMTGSSLAGPVDHWNTFASRIRESSTLAMGVTRIRTGGFAESGHPDGMRFRVDLRDGGWVLESSWAETRRWTWTGSELWGRGMRGDDVAVSLPGLPADFATAITSELQAGFANTTADEASPVEYLPWSRPSWEEEHWVRLTFDVAALENVWLFVLMGPRKPHSFVLVDRTRGRPLELPYDQWLGYINAVYWDVPLGDDLDDPDGPRFHAMLVPQHPNNVDVDTPPQPWDQSRRLDLTYDAVQSTSVTKGVQVLRETCTSTGEHFGEPYVIRYTMPPDRVDDLRLALDTCEEVSLKVGVSSRYRVDGTNAGVCVQGGFRLFEAKPDGSESVLYQQPIGACHQATQSKHRTPGWSRSWTLDPTWPVEDLVFEVRGAFSIDCFAPSSQLAVAAVHTSGHHDTPSIEWDCYPEL